MGAKASLTQSYAVNSDVICRILADPSFSVPLNIFFRGTNSVIGGTCFQFSHGATFFSWGELITVTVYPRSQTLTEVVFYSECTLRIEFVDWGKNKRNLKAMAEQLGRLLLPYAATAQSSAYCTACGKAVGAQDTFCSGCGKKLK